jgi:hypothetical protein
MISNMAVFPDSSSSEIGCGKSSRLVWLLLGSRMRLAVDFPQPADADLGVNLGGGQAKMAKQLLM